jgi:LmbE family N-acetylglucosaminyl deacetylase
MREKKPLLTALFIACHPDDIEIGAGGTVAHLAARGWTVWICILTKERHEDVAEQRRTEALEGAQLLGVPPENVLFAGFPDGDLECGRESVGQLRELLKNHHCTPDVVFTHTYSDSHNDHRAAHELTISTFRKKPILCYAVVNSLVISTFKPSVFIETAPYRAQKEQALAVHLSQGQRIDTDSIFYRIREYSRPLGLQEAEPFELIVQEGAEDTLFLVQGLNESAFHTFWQSLLNNNQLSIIYSAPVAQRKERRELYLEHEHTGVQELSSTFASLWHDKNPLELVRCNHPQAEKILWNSHVVLCGGSVSNSVTEHYFNHLQNLRFVVDYTMPDYKNVFIVDRHRKEEISAVYTKDEFGDMILTCDKGVLTVMTNPFKPSRFLIGCMGLHGLGTMACLQVLHSQLYLQELLTFLEQQPPTANTFQVLVEYRVAEQKTTVLYDTFTEIHS